MTMADRIPLSRERIITAAVAIVDAQGLEALSMRKLGASLGVEAMSLYNHVTNKDDVLDGVLDHVLREVPLPDPALAWDDQLSVVRPPGVHRSQAEFLAAHGIDELVAEGRRVWQERAHLGDLEAIRARSRVGEAEALTDPAGLGAFHVLEWPIA